MSPFGLPSSPTSLACLISGSSRGFGRSITLALTQHAGASRTTSLHLILLASASSPALAETASLARAAAAATSPPLALTLETIAYPFSLSPVARAPGHAALADALAAPAWAEADKKILFNNAGVLGRVKVPASALGFDDFIAAFAVNAAGHGALAADFLKHAQPGKRWIVHTTSKAAIAPFPSWMPYSASKAASEALHTAIAGADDGCRVLQYAPGPMRTDMADQAEEESAMYAVKKWVGTEESAWKMLGIMSKDDFKNGTHVDYFDQSYEKAEDKVVL